VSGRGGAGAGLLSALYLLALPFVAATALGRFSTVHDRASAVALAAALGALCVLWAVMVVRLAGAVRDLLRGRDVVARGGLLWLATILFAAISFATPAGAVTRAGAPAAYTVRPGDTLWTIAAARLGSGRRWPEIVDANRDGDIGAALAADPGLIRPGWRLDIPVGEARGDLHQPAVSHPITTTPTVPDGPSPSPRGTGPTASHDGGHVAWEASSLGAVPIVLAAKRRQDFLRQSRAEIDDDDVEATIELLRAADPVTLSALRRLVGEETSGVLNVDYGWSAPEDEPSDPTPIVAIVTGEDEDGCDLAFARPGFALPVGSLGFDEVAERAVVLGEAARCVTVTTPDEALRALALRRSFDDAVLFLGAASDLDADLAERCVSVASEVVDRRAAVTLVEADGPVVELLRAEPRVTGLIEEFPSGLRRRGIELAAYLAVHASEPVTGERLRARVLSNGQDASSRTLNNVASAVRRALGGDRRGPRLNPVSPAGLYQLHGVRCDLVEFHGRVAAARDDETRAASHLEAALTLVAGEPLATALRGFEWFLAEGHLARLQRDGEWAALRLADLAALDGDVDLAFWAIERGRLLDPYSDALEAALHRVPRLREFGRDRPGAAQHQSVGTR
jgi:hypothetical protein